MKVDGINGQNYGIKGHLFARYSNKEKMKKTLIMASVVNITVYAVSLRANARSGSSNSGSSKSSGSGSGRRKVYRRVRRTRRVRPNMPAIPDPYHESYDYMMRGSTSLPDTGYMPSSDRNSMFGRN